MNKKQKEVVRESFKINPLVAIDQWLSFTREDVNRKKFARRNARLVNFITK